MAAASVEEIKPGRSNNVLISNASDAQRVREILEENKIFDSRRRLKKISKGRIAIPFKDLGNFESVADALCKTGINIEKGCLELPLSKCALAQIPYDCMVASIHDLLGKDDVNFQNLVKDIPTHWERHGDLIVFPANSFTLNTWQDLGPGLWKVVATSLGCSRLAKKGTISSNGYRSPQVMLLLGDSGWVEHVDNGIRYTYDLTKCMFSAGNITEKLRVAAFNCAGETVVDLYAGIGYFTLPYLVHAKAAHVHACEWNPDAIDALKNTLVLNNVSDRCTIYQGDNRKTCPQDIADRVNLGLIPSSEEGWPVACRALKSSGGFLHIHSNVTSKHAHNADYSVSFEDTGDKSESSVCMKGGTAVNVNLINNGYASDGSNLFSERTRKDQDTLGESTMVGTDESHPSVEKTCKNKYGQHSTSDVRRKDWLSWAENVASKISELCTVIHKNHILWTAKIIHIEHVKSYAPHIDHLVLDLDCRPCTND
ncbi:tRNA wybutosine-synthesizing protein 2 homolog [Ylistrum balloti]|uniref:tRNA wybutosine-synthesizing protein 2 homolog n=1 Tax=Ylistrum balloti TaxID=509963 RepID=UPI00290597A3|nr:tRNA wybutosine-synthesizing protein 2 homolog [Ylistrum balloti]